jgi:hypothetical protein
MVNKIKGVPSHQSLRRSGAVSYLERDHTSFEVKPAESKGFFERPPLNRVHHFDNLKHSKILQRAIPK